MTISVVFVIKNGLLNGYCFWESLQSCLPFADEIIIADGYSGDGTWQAILRFANSYGGRVPIKIYRDVWPEKSYHGEAIRIVSEWAMERATQDWIYYLQADEVIHENSINHIISVSDMNYNSVSFPFYHFTRQWIPSEDGYKDAVRMVKRSKDAKLKGDAWTFENIDPVCASNLCPKPIFHFNWCFPKQNNSKDIEHAKLYLNYPDYQDRMKKALTNKNSDAYPLDPSFNDFPHLARRFVGQSAYRLP